ncbi:SRPBCC family protein [Amaricoccus tamworthensis]|uniref:SRPBCC family protein n=1 Tax=Amaricoccus tamworthensis TaxID=57002 RepID=UPI003C797BBC
MTMTETMRPEVAANRDVITKTAFFDAPREVVWSFLTNTEKLGRWYHPARQDLAEGRDYTLTRAGDDGGQVALIWGRVLEMRAPSLLRVTFVIEEMGTADTEVTFILEEALGGTRLTLLHEGVEAAMAGRALGLLGHLDPGWDEHLGSLRAAVRSR